MIGHPDDGPTPINTFYGDPVAGMYGALAIIEADQTDLVRDLHPALAQRSPKSVGDFVVASHDSSGPRPPRQDARSAMASAAARASLGNDPDSQQSTPQHLPSVAREIERKQSRQQRDLQYQTGAAQAEAPKPVRAAAKVGRNDPCPCGSGKKYKKCHGANV